MDKDDRNQGPNDNDRINKDPTSAVEAADAREFDAGGNVRKRGEDSSPDNRDRGETSSRSRPARRTAVAEITAAARQRHYPSCWTCFSIQVVALREASRIARSPRGLQFAGS